jgi:hypothetical protein
MRITRSYSQPYRSNVAGVAHWVFLLNRSIAAICTALPISRGITRSRLREMERAGLVVIEDVGRRTVGVGYSDGSLVKLATVAVAGSRPA